MELFVLILFTLLVLLILVTILSQVALWQRKEYRWDRMISYWKSPDARAAIYVPIAISYISGILAISCIYLGFIQGILFLAGVSIAAQILFHIYRSVKQGIYRPKFTVKAVTVLLFSFGAVVLLCFPFLLGFTQSFLVSFMITVLSIPLWVAGVVTVVNIPFALKKASIIRKATKKRADLTNIRVLGITGSYGKTSTKHFLEQIVRNSRQDVAATKEHHNSEIGVAYDVLQQLTPSTKIYIAEMGAYRTGEIAAIAECVKPQIGIVTAIGNQHIDVFSSQEKIAEAKKELVNALPPEGVSVLNLDDPIIQTWENNLQTKNVIWYSSTGNTSATVFIQHVEVEPQQISFDVVIEGKTYPAKVNLASKGLLASVVAAIAGAYALDISPTEIIQALADVQAFPQTMEIYTGKNSATIIDDSYSGGHKAALNAIEHLQVFLKADKRVVFVPIIELGKEAESVHTEIGKALHDSNAKIYIYGTQYKEALEKELPGADVVWITQPKRLVEEVTTNLTSDTVVLLEGRVPSILRKALQSKIV